MADQRKDKIFLAKLAEEMGRYEDMVGHMKDIIETEEGVSEGLSVEERSLLSVAYKNVIGARRASWRVTYGLEQRHKSEGREDLVALANQYRATIEKELVDYCNDVLQLINTRLIPNAKTAEFSVFYQKMKGDCYRYQAEIIVGGGDRKDISEQARSAYEEANKTASAELKSTDPTRLGLVLNYSVFLYEILGQPAQACQVAQKAFDLAMADLQERDGNYDDTTMILQSMRDNLILWTSQDSSEDEDSARMPPEAEKTDGEKEGEAAPSEKEETETKKET